MSFKADQLLKRATTFERLALFSDRKSFLQAIAQQGETWSDVARKEGDLPEDHSVPPPESDNILQVPETKIVGTPPQKVTFPPIPTDVQGALSRIVTVDGLAMPIKVDGKLGPETRKALDAFKKKYYPNNPNVTDQDTFNFIKSIHSRYPKYQ